MAYTPRASNFAPNMVGSLYHVGLSDGARQYGYVFQNDGPSSNGMWEKSNVADKEKLIQYSSTNIIDRDFAYYPRVTQGDFSGGGLQTIAIDATKYLDSDLDITTPSYLQLRPNWQRQSVTFGVSGNTGVNQVIAFNSNLYFTFGEGSGNVYQFNVSNVSPTVTSGSPAASPVLDLYTDGASLFAGQSGALYWTSGNVASWAAIATSLNGTAAKWWEIEQGTSGRFNYYSVVASGGDSLYKIDMNATRPVAPASQPQVPTANNAIHIVDVVPYQGSIAILSTDTNAQNGFDVWFHDGTNMTRIVRVDGYRAKGMCSCLGNLFVGCEDYLTFGGPVLIQIGSSGYQVVARPGVPGLYAAGQVAAQPRSSAEYVYWPVRLTGTPLNANPGGGAVPRVLVYNTITSAASFLPNADNADLGAGATMTRTGLDSPVRKIVSGFGGAVALCFQDGVRTGTLQYQQTATQQQPVLYQSSGWMVSSSIDFQTPGISKRFRRIEVKHTPLKAGESITVKAFVDQDPLLFTTTLAPVPSTATVTDNTLGSTVTLLPFGADTVGRSMYFAIQLNAGTSNQTTPRVISAAVEIGGTWSWDFTFDCSSRRRTLQQSVDGQGPNGKDLYFMLRNAYENGGNLTLILSPTLSYTVNVESLEGKNIAYLNHSQQAVKADEEWQVHAVLRQVI